MKSKIYLLSITALFVSAIIGILNPTQIHADDILKKAAFTGLYQCYISTSPEEIERSINGLSNDNHISIYVKKAGATERQNVILPNGYGHTIEDNNLNCWQLINGYSSPDDKQVFKTIISDIEANRQKAKHPEYFSDDQMINMLPKLGYTAPQSSNNDTPYYYFTYTYSKTAKQGGQIVEKNKEGRTDKFRILNLDANDTITDSSTLDVVDTSTSSGEYTLAGPYFETENKGRSILLTSKNNVRKSVALKNGETRAHFASRVYEEVKNIQGQYEDEITQAGSYVFIYHYTLNRFDPNDDSFRGVKQQAVANVDGEWKINSAVTAADTAIDNYYGSNFIGGHRALVFTQEEKSTLYKHYFKNWYKATVLCPDDEGYENAPYDAIEKEITGKKCFVVASEHKEEKVHGIKPEMTWYQDLSLAELIAEMSEDDILDANTYTDDTSTSAEREPDCHTNGGALAWVLCPIIDQATNMIEQVYDDWIQPYLSIDAVLFDTSETGGQSIHQIWSIFQGFANLAFVLLFLVVIFSQLTGVGIDNYGIKKILPKLIIGAVLINMSYIICQLAVDISNIVGRAIASMFQQIADNVGINSGLNGISVNLYPDQVQDAVENQFTTVGNDNGNGTIVLLIVPIVAILGLGIFLAAGPAIIIPVLLAVISVVIGIFFLFALLALRQAVAVILVVVSPMAFATYMLPNTKKLFDKWYEAFKGMLIAYPIASALVFGGDLVSKILLVASGSTLITSLGLLLSAAVVAIAPIFFIPSVIRKSMGALSGIANVLQSGQKRATKRLGEGTSNRVQKSGLQRSFNQFKQVHLGAGVNGKGELNAIGKMKNKLTLTARGRADLAEARQKALGYISADKTNKRMLSSAGIAAAGAGIAAKAAQQDINDEITNMTQKTHNYNVDVMEQELVNLMSKENLKDEEKVYTKALMTKLSQSGGDGNKRLINIISGKTKANGNKTASKAGRELFADYATSTDIASSMGGKDAYIMQYLRDVKSGAGGTTNETTFDKWLTSENADRQIDGNIVTNAEFVAKTVLDDDEMLMKQSSASLNRTVSIDAGKIIGSDGKTAITPNGPLENTIGGQGAKSLDARRAVRILSNDNINKKEEQIQKLKKAIRISRLNSNTNNHN